MADRRRPRDRRRPQGVDRVTTCAGTRWAAARHGPVWKAGRSRLVLAIRPRRLDGFIAASPIAIRAAGFLWLRDRGLDSRCGSGGVSDAGVPWARRARRDGDP